MKAAVPQNEEERLRVLQSYRVVDTPYEHLFDRITELARSLFGARIAAITLIDRDRQWFKSISGMDIKETSRDLSFCAHTILQNDVMIVTNAAEDVRFKDNPLVLNEPNIHFYAGAPLCSKEGVNLGTFCVIDRRHLDFSQTKCEQLKLFADIVMTLFNSKKQIEDYSEKINNYISEIQLVNEQLESKLAYEKEVANIFQIFNQVYNAIKSSKTLDEAHSMIDKYYKIMFPDEPSAVEGFIKQTEILKNFQGLTEREKQILRFHVLGLNGKQIANKLDISFKTVSRHLANICKKQNCHNKNDLIILAFKSGYFMELVSGSNRDVK